MDAQRLFKTPRQKDSEGGKVKKTDTPYFRDGEYVFNFLRYCIWVESIISLTDLPICADRTKQNVIHNGFLFQIESAHLLKKTPDPLHNDASNSTSSSNNQPTDDKLRSTGNLAPLILCIPSESEELSSSTTQDVSDSMHSSSNSQGIPIPAAATEASSSSGTVSLDKPWLSASYDPPSESSSPVTYGGYLTQSFMEHFQSANNSSAANAAVLRAKVLGRHLMHTNSTGSATAATSTVGNAGTSNGSSSAKDVALLLAESPSMALLSASNGSSRAHTPGGYPRTRIRTLSETSKRAQESQDDLFSLGIATSGSKDVIHESSVSSGASAGGSGGGGGGDNDELVSMLDIHASLLVN